MDEIQGGFYASAGILLRLQDLSTQFNAVAGDILVTADFYSIALPARRDRLMSLICYSVRDLIGRGFLPPIHQVYRSVAKLINLISRNRVGFTHVTATLRGFVEESFFYATVTPTELIADVLFTYK